VRVRVRVRVRAIQLQIGNTIAVFLRTYSVHVSRILHRYVIIVTRTTQIQANAPQV